MTRALVLVALALTTSNPAAAETVRTEAAGLRFAVPKTWTRVPTAVETRAAEYRLPRAPGDQADTELVLSFLGEGKGGSAEENLERWYERFTQPDGRPSKAATTVTTRTVKDLRVTAIDLAGTYVGTPGGPIQAGVSGYRLLGAAVEGPGGPWFVQVLGPTASVGQAKADFDALLGSLEAHR
jgi:hypothetical protein